MFSLKNLRDVRLSRGIYALVQDKELVYIGRSYNIYERILEHSFEDKKEFNRVFALVHSQNKGDDRVKKADTEELQEVALISLMKPKYNKLVIENIREWFYTLPSSIFTNGYKSIQIAKIKDLENYNRFILDTEYLKNIINDFIVTDFDINSKNLFEEDDIKSNGMFDDTFEINII